MKVLELTYAQVVAEIKRRYGKGAYHAAALYREIFKKQNTDFKGVTEFARSGQLTERLRSDLTVSPGEVVGHQSEDGVIKFITRLTDQLEIESVILPMFNRLTLCISSQVGCRMGCRFCATARMGWRRNLTVEEIVGQVYSAHTYFGSPIRNIVFMGMGEPFDNFDNVVQAIQVISDQRGFNIAKRRITVSSAGRVDGLAKLAERNWPDLNIAISLNAPNNALRSELMPLNRKIPLERLQAALMQYPLPEKKTFFIEYVLLKGINDQQRHAEELAAWLQPLSTKVNLIPYNAAGPTIDRFAELSPTAADLDRFKTYLIDKKVFVRLRRGLGQTIMAGCGQLGNNPISS